MMTHVHTTNDDAVHTTNDDAVHTTNDDAVHTTNDDAVLQFQYTTHQGDWFLHISFLEKLLIYLHIIYRLNYALYTI